MLNVTLPLCMGLAIVRAIGQTLNIYAGITIQLFVDPLFHLKMLEK